MPGSRSRSSATQPATLADDRIPPLTSDQPLSCRTDPTLFAIEDVDTDEDRAPGRRPLPLPGVPAPAARSSPTA